MNVNDKFEKEKETKEVKAHYYPLVSTNEFYRDFILTISHSHSVRQQVSL